MPLSLSTPLILAFSACRGRFNSGLCYSSACGESKREELWKMKAGEQARKEYQGQTIALSRSTSINSTTLPILYTNSWTVLYIMWASNLYHTGVLLYVACLFPCRCLKKTRVLMLPAAATSLLLHQPTRYSSTHFTVYHQAHSAFNPTQHSGNFSPSSIDLQQVPWVPMTSFLPTRIRVRRGFRPEETMFVDIEVSY